MAGVWRASLSLAGFALAYTMSFLWGVGLASLIENIGVSAVLSYLLAVFTIFTASVMTATSLPVLIYPALRRVSQTQKQIGAILGAVMGFIVGLVALWLVSTFSGVMSLQKSNSETEKRLARDDINSEEKDVLERVAATFVAAAVKTGMTVVGVEEQKVNIATAFIRAPGEFSYNLRRVARAPELKAFWLDSRTQVLMATNDLDGLIDDPIFQDLVNVGGMRELLKTDVGGYYFSKTDSEVDWDNPHAAKASYASSVGAERYLGENMSFIWRRMHVLRSDPRVVSILEDPEIKSLVEQQNPAVLLANEKIRKLVDIVMEHGTASENEMAGFDLSGEDVLGERNSDLDYANHAASVRENKANLANPIYKWLDDQGQIRYTDYMNIPQEKRDGAKLIAP